MLPGFEFLWRPHGHRYVVLHGGRGSGKSHAVAQRVIGHALEKPRRILCVREVQKSLAGSSKTVIEEWIERLKADDLFISQRDRILCVNGSEIGFLGLGQDPAQVKSYEGLSVVWCEEADRLKARSMRMLLPTIREPGSILYFTLNPTLPTDPTYAWFVGPGRSRKAIKIEQNWTENPLIDEGVLEEKDAEYASDHEYAMHVWEGKLLTRGEALVFPPRSWEIGALKPPDDAMPLFGLDIGLSSAITAAVKVWVWGRELYIERELTTGGQLDYHGMGHWLEGIAPNGATIRCDWQVTIGPYQGRRAGFDLVHALKKPNSIAEGIAWMKGYDMTVHPSCVETIKELRNYSYHVDPKTDAVDMGRIAKGQDDHLIDAIRYAVEPLSLGAANMKAPRPPADFFHEIAEDLERVDHESAWH